MSWIILILVTFGGGEVKPASAEMNVLCHDGTASPTCEVCRQGCCSHHGGCR